MKRDRDDSNRLNVTVVVMMVSLLVCVLIFKCVLLSNVSNCQKAAVDSAHSDEIFDNFEMLTKLHPPTNRGHCTIFSTFLGTYFTISGG